ncbi:MAG TPA: 4'-phosphopantetheinyl transferase superfamily protein [Pyrinomonadaceae bacterium]
MEQSSGPLNDHQWPLPPAILTLTKGNVHVWRASLHQFGTYADHFYALLDNDERTRAARFHFERHRTDFVVARGILRMLLSLYVGLEPQEFRFVFNPFGKPSLALTPAPVRFNLSHSNKYALYAFSREREVGIDIEELRPDVAEETRPESFFSPAEVTTLRALDPAFKTQAFFDCWTRKEAYIKAVGKGVSLPLDEFSVSLTPGTPAALLAAADPLELSRWYFKALSPLPNYAAALVVEGNDLEIRYYDLRLAVEAGQLTVVKEREIQPV